MPLRNPLEKDDLTEMSAIGAKLISAQSPLRGPGCVKTCTSRECAELFSLFSSFDGDCQSGSFLIQRNRDRLSTRKPDVGVFTQSGSPGSDIAALLRDICSTPNNGHRATTAACPFRAEQTLAARQLRPLAIL